MTRRSSIIATVVSLAAILVLAIGLERSRIIRLPWQESVPKRSVRVKASAEQFQNLCADIEFVSADSISSAKDLEQILTAALDTSLESIEQRNTPALDTQALEQLRNDLSEIIYRRWQENSFDSYDAFMRSHGYKIRSTEDLVKSCAIDLVYPAATGQPWDPSMEPGKAVETIWQAWKDNPPGSGTLAVLRGLADQPDGVSIAFRRVCPGDLEYFPTPGGPLGEQGWLGERQTAFNMFYVTNDGSRRSDQLAAGRCVMLATVGWVMQFEDKRFLPILFWFWFDPQSQRWVLEKVGAGNIPEGVGGIFF